jgi:hypothetical protein
MIPISRAASPSPSTERGRGFGARAYTSRSAGRSYTSPGAGHIRAAASPRSFGGGGSASPGGASPLVVHNAELVKRLQQLTPVLVGLAQDLASARRVSAALKRENRRLRSRVATLEGRLATTTQPQPGGRTPLAVQMVAGGLASDASPPSTSPDDRQPLGARRKLSVAIPRAITVRAAPLAAIDRSNEPVNYSGSLTAPDSSLGVESQPVSAGPSASRR